MAIPNRQEIIADIRRSEVPRQFWFDELNRRFIEAVDAEIADRATPEQRAQFKALLDRKTLDEVHMVRIARAVHRGDDIDHLIFIHS